MSAPMEVTFDTEELCEIEATVATGFEEITKEEAEEKLHVKAEINRGRIIFKIPIKDVKRVLDLRGIENCYVVMSRVKNIPFTDDELECMALLRHLVYSVDWKHGLAAWNQIFHFTNPIASKPDIIPENLGEPTLASRFHQKTYTPVGNKMSKRQKRREKMKKRKSEPVEEKQEKTQEFTALVSEDSHENNDPQIEGQLKESRRNSEEQATASESETNVDRTHESSNLSSEKDCSVTSSNIENEEKSTEERSPVCKKPRTTEYDPMKPSFRVTCDRHGDGHPFDSMGAASNFGGAVYNYFHWNVSMKNFDIEVVLSIVDKDVNVCLGLTRRSLHYRFLTAYGPTPLRPTIAYNMLRLCKIEPGEVICDPMCGGGSIPIQAAVEWPDCMHICGEIARKALMRTTENVQNVAQTSPISLSVLRWDVTKLPLKTESVDVFITDLPFGIRIGSKMDNWKLYPSTLMEMARVTRVSGGRACLLTQDKKCIKKALAITSKYWKCRKAVGFNMGGLAACVYLLHRTVEYYNIADATESLNTALIHAKTKEDSHKMNKVHSGKTEKIPTTNENTESQTT